MRHKPDSRAPGSRSPPLSLPFPRGVGWTHLTTMRFLFSRRHRRHRHPHPKLPRDTAAAQWCARPCVCVRVPVRVCYDSQVCARRRLHGLPDRTPQAGALKDRRCSGAWRRDVPSQVPPRSPPRAGGPAPRLVDGRPHASLPGRVRGRESSGGSPYRDPNPSRSGPYLVASFDLNSFPRGHTGGLRASNVNLGRTQTFSPSHRRPT